jgi:RimJ/RimL family protein N-acetyltransferase
LTEQRAGRALPFAVIHRGSGEVIGTTRFGAIAARDRGVEIGWTWYATAHQRTGVNTECKYLLLRHAFDTLDALRVQLKTDTRNHRSRAAIERIGASLEGVWRSHMVLDDGTLRDTVVYSIVRPEWPRVREHLERLLRR